MDATAGRLVLIAVAVAAIALTTRALRRSRSRRREQGTRDAMMEVTDIVLATSRAGYSVAQTAAMIADFAPRRVRTAFESLNSAVQSGIPLVTALSRVRTELGPTFQPLIGLMISALRLGVPTEQFIVQLQANARHAHRQHGESLARSLPVRLTTPLVTCTLPSFIVLIIVPTVAGTLQQLRLDGGTP